MNGCAQSTRKYLEGTRSVNSIFGRRVVCVAHSATRVYRLSVNENNTGFYR